MLEPINIRREEDGRIVLAQDHWPEMTTFSDDFIRAASHSDDHPTAHMSYPWITLTFDNAWACYRIETCDRGVWTGTLSDHLPPRNAA